MLQLRDRLRFECCATGFVDILRLQMFLWYHFVSTLPCASFRCVSVPSHLDGETSILTTNTMQPPESLDAAAEFQHDLQSMAGPGRDDNAKMS